MSASPLAGLKVLEFSHTVMGPTAGLIFAELGADHPLSSQYRKRLAALLY